MKFEEINELIEEKKDEIKVAKQLKLGFCLPLGTITAVLVALACVINPLWTIGVVATGFSYIFSEITFTNSIKMYKKELKGLHGQRNRADLEEETVVNHIYQTDVIKNRKISNSLISNKIENNESKEDDLTL